MNVLGQRFSQGAQWYNERPVRERALILATAVVLVLLVGWELAVAPVLTGSTRLQGDISQARQQLQSWQAQSDALAVKAQEDPNAELRARLKSRERRLASLDGQLAESTDRLIAPRAMVSLLRDMLSAQKELELVKLELLEPVPVFSEQGDAEETAVPLLFAHDVELVIAGGYLDFLAYLERLEALDGRLGWNRLTYEVTEFPRAEARVRVRTLSLSRAWLGV